jgi:hypothetical protein
MARRRCPTCRGERVLDALVGSEPGALCLLCGARWIVVHGRRLDIGRICADRGCETVLSRYNAERYCGVHRHPSYATPYRW